MTNNLKILISVRGGTLVFVKCLVFLHLLYSSAALFFKRRANLCRRMAAPMWGGGAKRSFKTKDTTASELTSKVSSKVKSIRIA